MLVATTLTIMPGKCMEIVIVHKGAAAVNANEALENDFRILLVDTFIHTT